ncbi:MAG: DMT family transporter [Alphaproteobacteria bacterium]|jgi:drug/metabolite transporter (DMT)-like permease|nr:DMT family transporter [Beijerinckiaceae bacterium]NBQ38203.1 DMT family transporter [Alphaproteobacteria bacterium]
MTIYWVLAAIIGAAGQTARNAMQRNLTAKIGTVGATQVRFLYGLPFAIAFLGLASVLTDHAVPSLNQTMLGFTFCGSVAQILATALMLLAMRETSFAVTTAYTKTEPVQVAIFGVIVLGDVLSLASAISIIVATAGVMMMAIKPGDRLTASGLRPAAYGIASGAFFALSAVSFRGGIIGIGDAPFALRASTVLVTSLAIQTLLLMVYMVLFNRKALLGSLKVWQSSLFAGFMGAFASQAWFIGFSLTSAAHVRTLGLVEMIFAQIVTRGLLNEKTTRREWAGMTFILAGVAALLVLG